RAEEIGMDLGDLTIEIAQPLVGTTFTLMLEDGRTTTMTLDEALPYDLRQRRRRTAPKRAPFSLYFLGDPAIMLPQGMYTFRSEAITFEHLFIVPIGHDAQATEYEAVFGSLFGPDWSHTNTTCSWVCP